MNESINNGDIDEISVSAKEGAHLYGSVNHLVIFEQPAKQLNIVWHLHF